MESKYKSLIEIPSVVISIDFEMRWGVHDIFGLNFNEFQKELENCRPVVLKTLKLLAERNISATWATVGALGLNGWDEYFQYAPPSPAYVDKSLAVRREYADLDPNGVYHFTPDLIREISKTPRQDLGSHSFSHTHFREPGVTGVDFLADMMAVERLWKDRFDTVPVSLVYPRNQSAFIDLIPQTCIKVWRGSEPAWFYDCTSHHSNTLVPRLFRLVDSIAPWSVHTSIPVGGMLRATIYVRFRLPETLWSLQILKIRRILTRLKNKDVLHLWWHPQDLGSDLKKGITRLTQVLDLIGGSQEGGKIISKSMKDFVD